MRISRQVRVVAPVMAICLALGACAQSPGSPAQPEGGSVNTSPAQPSPSEEPALPGPTRPVRPAPTSPAKPTPPPASAAPTRLTGTVTAGVEPGCLLLDGYLLVGGPRDVLRPGARVTVTGQADPGLITTCQQGTPFRVESASPA